MTNPSTEFLLYTGSDGQTNVTVLVQDETVWITQEAMQQLFGRVKSTISEHISNVFSERELERDSVVRNFRTTAIDGKAYNLDVIISTGAHPSRHAMPPIFGTWQRPGNGPSQPKWKRGLHQVK